jgi:SAM-dependent methyltransferase
MRLGVQVSTKFITYLRRKKREITQSSRLGGQGNFNTRLFQPDLPLPKGISKQAVIDSLVTISIDGSAVGELTAYATEDCERFLHTVNMLPDAPVRVLEIGGNPYFTTILAKRLKPAVEFHLTNYFGGDTEPRRQNVEIVGFDGKTERYDFDYLNINVEADSLPFEDGYFDIIIFCEVIEHLTNDPVAALLNLKRVLKKDGFMILSTPNVARLENVARMIAGQNIYDPYSGYGPYGRHNREYSRHELYHLMQKLGFDVNELFTVDVHENRASSYLDVEKIMPLVQFREQDLGQYIFGKWRNSRDPEPLKPSWLYRSYPSDELDGRYI